MTSTSAKRSRAFTLVELLVVIAIIGVLVGAAPSGRASRSRGLAAIAMSEQPAAGRTRVSELPVRQRRLSDRRRRRRTVLQSRRAFQARLRLRGRQLDVPDSAVHRAAKPVQPASRRRRRERRIRRDGSRREAGLRLQLSVAQRSDRGDRASTSTRCGDYAGVMANWNDPGWQGFAWQTSVPPNANEETLVWTGILVKGGQVNKTSTPPQVWKFPKVDFKSIEDGSSNTILVAEKAVPIQYYTIPNAATWPYWEMYGYYTGADWPHMRLFGALKPAGAQSERRGSAARRLRQSRRWHAPTPEFGFGSAHPGVICSVWGDGSTRTISMSADLTHPRPARQASRSILGVVSTISSLASNPASCRRRGTSRRTVSRRQSVSR